jgi:hypothetical protein
MQGGKLLCFSALPPACKSYGRAQESFLQLNFQFFPGVVSSANLQDSVVSVEFVGMEAGEVYAIRPARRNDGPIPQAEIVEFLIQFAGRQVVDPWLWHVSSGE